MFSTCESGKNVSFSQLREEHFWDFVGIPFQAPWLYVTYTTVCKDDVAMSATLCLSTIEQVVEMSRWQNIKVNFVDLVSPGHWNGTDRWKMEPLQEVWIHPCIDDPELYEYEYKLLDGSSYMGSAQLRPDEKLLRKTMIFQVEV